MTTVGNLKFLPKTGSGMWVPSSRQVYIGRVNVFYAIQGSKWQNKFQVKRGRTREDVLKLFADDLDINPILIAQAKINLLDKELVCWCRPRNGFQGKLMCHGQIWVARIEGIKPEEVD